VKPRKPAPDQAQRDAAIRARGVNVIADAGAGTGKTTLLVARLVDLVAPEGDGAALDLARVAAITFTRKAAGELKLGIREALLRELARGDLTDVRRGRLAGALAALDTAHVGTIHAFADRLLRLQPVEAGLSPSYEIVEDDRDLVGEAFALLLHASQTGTLAAELAGRIGEEEATAAQAALADSLRAGIRAERRVHPWGETPGLDCLVEALVRTRDVHPRISPAEEPDLGRFRALVDEYVALAAASSGEGRGSRWVAHTRERLERARALADPVRILAELLRRAPPQLKKKEDFPDDDAGWAVYKAFRGDAGRKPLRDGALYEDLLRPFARWMARRLVAATPAVVAAYEKVKARRRAVDQVDLLLGLRNLLRDDPGVRAEYQQRFDHVLVDEFQDTDPLQAEIVLYLCEDGPRVADWREVALVPGKLTLVGDPKQSIYRFRRADIAMYEAVRAVVERRPHLVVKLTASFRSDPALVAWLNERFDDVLGTAAGGERGFDPDAGTVANERLLPGREGDARIAVQVLPIAAEGGRKPELREAEARAVAAWLRRLVAAGGITVVDPSTRERRAARWGDVAILAGSTPSVPLLFPELDRLGVPYTARGGSLFLGDALHRQFLLGLRAVADRDDGLARAALLRPPFFALDYDDLARARAAEPGSTHPGVLRARAALELVRELRLRRHARSPGTTARELLEQTAFARHAALGPNGAQRLDALRELCLAVDAAAAEGLDFDAATARLREWAVDPVPLDPPRPVGGEAVQILTIHQAKGLEFPIVVLWDACAELTARDARSTFVVDRTGASWAVGLGLDWEEPEGARLAERERRYLDAERKRLLYVAATRARDLLVLPVVAGEPNPGYVSGRLLAGAPAEGTAVMETYEMGKEPGWAREVAAPTATATSTATPTPTPTSTSTALEAEVDAAWRSAVEESARPRFAPAAVTAEARAAAEEPEELSGEAGRRWAGRESRFGPVFGDTVHLAIGLALRDPALGPAAAVDRAAAATGLAKRRAEAAEDVARALSALEREGLRRPPGPDLQLEYPVAQARDGRLVAGYVDLVAAGAGGVAILDFKTDAPPAVDVAQAHPAYAEQVRTYARMLEDAGLATAGAVRAGLLFTADGTIRWLPRA
jgi:ATP-dependent exoDNAse (exonuclease V) beta subunit